MKETSLKMFEQHGYVEKGTTSNQSYGNCIFCGEKAHFYINTETLQFDCKKCGKSGGSQTFLKEIANHCKKNFTGEVAKVLSEDRGISIKTLREADIGYNTMTDTYTIPIRDMEGLSIIDVRMYRIGSKLISTKGSQTALYGWDNLISDTIWLCEGEWDALAMREILKENGIKQTILAVQGANVFKGDWVNIFRKKAVFVLYDNDDAGRKGAEKVYTTLNAIVDSIKFIWWSEKYPEGFDIRDYYIKKNDAEKALKGIAHLMELFPQGMEVKTQNIKFNGKGVMPAKVYKQYMKWLKFPRDNTDVLDVIFGTIIANRLIGDPLWLFVVAPSGCMKSELVQSLFEVEEVFSASSLTPHSLISGCNFGIAGDPSMIPKLNRKVFVIKDFTMILGMNTNDRDEIFAILRDAYDGYCEKAFGNGIFRAYKSKFGIVAGVTPEIERYTEEHVSLGERFLKYRIPMSSINLDESMEMIFKAMDNVTSEDLMKSDLISVANKVLDYDYENKIPVIPPNIMMRIGYLAKWTSILRSAVPRDKYTREITGYSSEELGTRLGKQFKKLLLGIGMFRRLDKIGDSEYQIIKYIANDTIPSKQEKIIRLMYGRNKSASYTDIEISEMIHLPLRLTQILLSNLDMQGVLRKERLSNIKIKWGLTDEILNIIERSGVYIKGKVRKQ